VAYRAEIEIVAKGVTKVTQLQKGLNQLAKQIDLLNGPGSLKDFNSQLAQARKLLDSAQQGTVEEKRAVNQYVSALKNANTAQARTNQLIAEEIRQRDGATASLERYNAAAASIRQPGGSMSGRYLRPGSAVGRTAFSTPIGPQPGIQFGSTTQFGPIGGPSSSVLGGQSSPIGDRLNRSLQAAKELDEVYGSIDRIAAKTVAKENERVQALGKGTQEVVNLANSYRNIGKQTKTQAQQQNEIKRQILETKKAAGDEAEARSRDFLQRLELTKQVGKERRDAMLLADREAKTEEKINKILQRRVDQRENLARRRRGKIAAGRRQQKLTSDIALGAGFPLLFGGGPGAILGGVGGAIAGKGGQGSFAAQIFGSALGAQIDAFVQGQTEIAASLQESTDVFAALESAGFKVAGSLKAVVEELEESGDAAGAYRIQQAELQKAYGANAVTDLSNFDAANQRLADSIKRITSGVLPPVLRVLTAMTDISAGAINLFVDGVEAVRDAFRFIAGNENATGDRARPDFRLVGGFAQADASRRSLVGLREEKALELEKERKKIIDQINNNQRKFAQEREREANKKLQNERAFAKVKMDSLRMEQKFAKELFQIDLERARLRGQQLQQQGSADKLKERFEQRGKIAEFSIQQLRGFPGGQLQAAELFQEIRAGEIDKVKQDLQQLSALMATSGENTDVTKERFQRLLTIFTELKQLEMDDEFRQIMDAMNAPFTSLENEQELLIARLEGNEKEVELKQAIASITKDMNATDSERAEKLIRGNAALKEQVVEAEKLKDLYQSVGSAIENGIVNGITAAIEGTRTLKEVVADVLKDISKLFLQFAIKGLLQSFSSTPGGGGGGQTFENIGGFDFGSKTGIYADGGFVSGPTNALVGEGGESEYIIPESKMRESMARYSRGARGSSVIPEAGGSGTSGEGGGVAVAAPIDVRYSVERINSVDYVTADQFQQGMQQAATQGAKQGEQQTLKRLQMSGSTRRRIGI